MTKYKLLATVALMITILVIALALVPCINAQTTRPPSLSKTSLVPPPAAQAQIIAGAEYATAMINELNHRLGNDTSIAHAAAILRQMTAEGKITCPTPFTSSGHCYLVPPGVMAEQLPVPPRTH